MPCHSSAYRQSGTDKGEGEVGEKGKGREGGRARARKGQQREREREKGVECRQREAKGGVRFGFQSPLSFMV